MNDFDLNPDTRKAVRELLKEALRSTYTESKLYLDDQMVMESEVDDFAKEHVDQVEGWIWGYVTGEI